LKNIPEKNKKKEPERDRRIRDSRSAEKAL